MSHTKSYSAKIIPTVGTTRIGFAPAYDLIEELDRDIKKFCKEHDIAFNHLIRSSGVNEITYRSSVKRKHMDVNMFTALYYVIGYDISPQKKKGLEPIFVEKEFIDTMIEYKRKDRLSQAAKRGCKVDENGNVLPKIRIKKPKRTGNYEQDLKRKISRRELLDSSEFNATNFLSVD